MLIRLPLANLINAGLAAAAGLSLFSTADAGVPEKIRYNEHVRPILSNTCFYCHGPDEKHREAHLRLDTRDGATADNDGVRAIVPGKPEDSELLLRVLSHDKDEVMPPPKSKKPLLTEGDIAILRKWIEQGAEYEAHWAFLPLSEVAPPTVTDDAWVKNPIDRFILARIEREGIKPSPEADRETLIRRVSLDLTGLLPSPEEVSSFVNDKDPNAYERLVERLLSSPHYGERWGRHWLDQARYAESNGYTIDSERPMWPFRDWVIKALNDDMPFDQFTIEQLAGDLLQNPTKNELIATAFHRNTLINEEGGTKPEQFRVEAVMDRVNTTGAVWLGLTVGCAQCHSHKFDPISYREYYQLFGFFNQGVDVNNKGATVQVARGEVFGKTAPVEAQSPALAEDKGKAQSEWEQRELKRLQSITKDAAPVKWSAAQYVEYDTVSGAGFQLLDDNSLLADGNGSFNDTYRVLAKTSLNQVAAVRVRVLTHDSLPKHGPGTASNGNFVLTEFEASVGGKQQPIAQAFADHEQPGYPATATFDGDTKSGWAINVGKGSMAKMNADHEIVFVFEKPIAVGDAPIELRLHHDLNERYLVGRFAIDFAATAPKQAGAGDERLFTELEADREHRTSEQARLVLDAFERATSTKREGRKKGAADMNTAELMVMKEVDKPRPTFLFQRGDFLRPDEKAGPLQPGVIAAVQAGFRTPPQEFRNRLDLARWLVSPENPLTPRVTINRMWMRYFGRGIVETDEDFGAQGSAPTHPELLDWLGREFIRQGWSMKAMHRLIVTSATYRQSSNARPDATEKDPRNLLLARQERVRVDAEIIRDAALSASGLLDRTIGGPSVRPPQAEGVYAFTQTKKEWKASTGPDRFRRALYTQFYRSSPYPLFTTFDAPDFQTVCTRRVRSNTPLQALTLANDPAFFEIAQGLAVRVLREVPGVNDDARDSRLKRAFVLCFCREPSARELEILRGYYAGEAQAFSVDENAAKALLPEKSIHSDITPAIAAAMVTTARTLLNTDAFITRE
ncbi:PSD1 and planctomycete cytochrome C domain-containing protein [Verrucomicrobiota bacterium sgz303538]